MGTVRPNANNSWTAQASLDWGIQIYNIVDYKHIDCDGSGISTIADSIPLSLNYSLTHSKAQGINAVSGAPLYLETLYDSLMVGDTGYVRVMLGDVNTPVNNLHGIAFTFDYDPTLIDTNSVMISYDTTWISATNNNGLGMSKDFYNLGRTDAGYTHTNLLTSSGYGMIAGITFVTIDNISGKNAIKSETLQLGLSGVVALDGAEMPLEIAAKNDSLVIWDIENSVTAALVAPEIKVYPNPSNGLFQIDAGGTSVQDIRVLDLQGRLLAHSGPVTQLDLHDLPVGMYFLQMTTANGIATQKIEIVK